ncbi:MAG: bifunctional adenosylcobinamide kinase/adenosylcobinamide-phosphate guanylyltransferase [Dehalococcoidia bacterium]|nr:bifunctional adenosylcobinamide kinase/adenosylcobinamide-phosphate guanylyltransferase [Dehalococcoidia bacterium]
MAEKLIFLLGGGRSGKSALAQSMAVEKGDKVLFVATGEALDDEMDVRIEKHKKSRPEQWRTLELSLDVGQRLRGQFADAGVIILDCLTLLVSNVLTRDEGKDVANSGYDARASAAESRVEKELENLIDCIDEYRGIFIVVSNEVGLGLVPEGELGRLYRDCLGRVNQRVARHADEVLFLVSGIPVRIKG